MLALILVDTPALARKRRVLEATNTNYDLQIIDLYQQPEVAMAAHIIVAPTLVGWY